MRVRVARFEGIDVARVDEDAEQFKNMLRTDDALSGCPRKRSRPYARASSV
jgi:hypothetical protein